MPLPRLFGDPQAPRLPGPSRAAYALSVLALAWGVASALHLLPSGVRLGLVPAILLGGAAWNLGLVLEFVRRRPPAPTAPTAPAAASPAPPAPVSGPIGDHVPAGPLATVATPATAAPRPALAASPPVHAPPGHAAAPPALVPFRQVPQAPPINPARLAALPVAPPVPRPVARIELGVEDFSRMSRRLRRAVLQRMDVLPPLAEESARVDPASPAAAYALRRDGPRHDLRVLGALLD